MLPFFKIDSNYRVIHFLAQVGHESGSFNYKEENLNYGCKALKTVFGKYYKDVDMLNKHARKPQLIANRVYANRMGNGNEQSGDGWKFRGRGLIQLTGKDNYKACGDFLKLDFIVNPDELLSSSDIIVKSAAWFWNSRRLNELADTDDVRKITACINGGYHGLKERIEFVRRAKLVLGVE